MDFYLGQIGIYGFNFAPQGWAMCVGTLLPIPQNTALFSLIGTYYGGNGQTTFGLPDLRSRTAIGFDSNAPLGAMAGTESVTLVNSQMPIHSHNMTALSTAGAEAKMDGRIFAQSVQPTTTPPTPQKFYGPLLSTVTLNPATVSMTGGTQPHSNIQPSLAVNFCISTTGYYPSRS
jgi:microcystin-dependent protein